MNVQLCKSCGNAFDLDEFQDGYCDSCLPDSGVEVNLCAPFEGMTEPWTDEEVARLHKALEGVTHHIPPNLSREEKRQLIISVANGDCV
jgi:hypothetical protein